MAEESSDFGVRLTQPPAVRCSYCGKTHEDSENHEMGLESSEWAVCFSCVRKALDKVYGGENK